MSESIDFGTAVRRLRLSKNLKRTEVARGSGIDGQSIYRYESGKRQPSLEAALAISRYLEQQTGVAILKLNTKGEVE